MRVIFENLQQQDVLEDKFTALSIALNDAFQEQINLKDNVDKFNESAKPKSANRKRKVTDSWKRRETS